MVQGRTLPSLKENERFFLKKVFRKWRVFFFSFYSSNLGTFYYTVLISLIPLLNCVYNYLDRNWFLAITLGRMSWHLQFWFSLASETQNVPYEPHVLVISSYIFYFGHLPYYQHHIGPLCRWQHVNCDWWARNGKRCETLVTHCTLEDASWIFKGLLACCIGKVLMAQLSGGILGHSTPRYRLSHCSLCPLQLRKNIKLGRHL